MVAFVKKLLPPHSQQLGLRRIKDTDIGVVSPYRKQCWKLNHKFRRLHYDGITVGTSEVFQGKEKPVMIVSTVRSGDSLGFVKEERVSNNFNLLICHRMKVLHFWQGFFVAFCFYLQRFNVILTRAKCLLIVIGDPHTLRLDANWKLFMKYCLDNGGFIQSNKPYGVRFWCNHHSSYRQFYAAYFLHGNERIVIYLQKKLCTYCCRIELTSVIWR